MENFLRGFSESDFKQNEGQGGSGVNYIKAPSAHVVTLAVKYAESNNKKTPGLEITFTNAEGAVVQDNNWITPNSFSVVLGTISKIALEAGVKEQLIAATNKRFVNEEDWVNSVASVINGISVAAAFKAVEYMNDKGETKNRSEFWFANSSDNLESVQSYVTSNSDKATVQLKQKATTQDFGAMPPESIPPAFDPFATSGPAAANNINAVFSNH